MNFLVREKSYERKTEEMLIDGRVNILIAHTFAVDVKLGLDPWAQKGPWGPNALTLHLLISFVNSSLVSMCERRG